GHDDVGPADDGVGHPAVGPVDAGVADGHAEEGGHAEGDAGGGDDRAAPPLASRADGDAPQAPQSHQPAPSPSQAASRCAGGEPSPPQPRSMRPVTAPSRRWRTASPAAATFGSWVTTTMACSLSRWAAFSTD